MLSEILALLRTYKVLLGNREELLALLVGFEDPRVSLPLLDMDHHDELEAFLAEVDRRLHNFVASVQSLIDHTRVLVRQEYPVGTPFRDAYEARKDEAFSNAPLARFVKDLRQYTQHRRLPASGSHASWSGHGSDLQTRVTLNVGRLRDWDKWSAPARRYLDELEDVTPLIEPMRAYGELVVEFYTWFGAKQAEVHRAEFEELGRLTQRYNDLVDREP